jgi:hypothetical protein
MRFLGQDLNCGADGTTADDLTEGAQRSIALAGMKVGSPSAGDPAKARDNGVVVKNFD